MELCLRRWTLSRGFGDIADRERLSSLEHSPLSFDSGPGFRVVARDSGRIGRALIRRYVGFVDRQGGERCDRQHQRRGHTSGNYSPYSTLPRSLGNDNRDLDAPIVCMVRSSGSIGSPYAKRAGAMRTSQNSPSETV